jgi:hypothetical protein
LRCAGEGLLDLVNPDDAAADRLDDAERLTMLASESPTNLDLRAPRSIRRSGTPQAVATAFAVRLLPVPGGPTSNMPFGAGNPYSRALGL